jgi:hypothetical protein
MSDEQALEIAAGLRRRANECRKLIERSAEHTNLAGSVSPQRQGRLQGKASAYQHAAELIEERVPNAPKFVQK